jgi:hypothetical protein
MLRMLVGCWACLCWRSLLLGDFRILAESSLRSEMPNTGNVLERASSYTFESTTAPPHWPGMPTYFLNDGCSKPHPGAAGQHVTWARRRTRRWAFENTSMSFQDRSTWGTQHAGLDLGQQGAKIGVG